MKKELFTLISSAVLAFGLPAHSRAAEAPAAPEAPAKAVEAADSDEADGAAQAGPARALPYHGDVAAVDAATRTFTFKNKDGKERVFRVSDTTAIMAGGAKADFSAITMGAYATGQYSKAADGKLEAISVKIAPKPEKKESK